MRFPILIFLGISFLLTSCSDRSNPDVGGIVMGDSSMIVTERDTQYLLDFVDDITLRTTDTIRISDIEPQESPPLPDGITIAFSEVELKIPGINTISLQEQNPAKSSGVSYKLTSGSMADASLYFSGARIKEVSQRYITVVVLENEVGSLRLESLKHLSEWKILPGTDGVYQITGLEVGDLESKKTTPAQIRQVVRQTAQRRGYSRKNIQHFEQSVKNVKSVSEEPLSVHLETVMWKVVGQSAEGRNFVKQIRIDL